jgi:hypothetical protein
MKKLISPPIQSLFLLGTLSLVGWAVWNVYSLKLLDGSHDKTEGAINVQIPDGGVLDTPALDTYHQMLDAPLFWTTRKPPPPPKPPEPKKEEQAEAPPPPVDLALPEGRLVGIIDVGNSLFGVMEGSSEKNKSQRLHKNDKWGSWTVSEIKRDKLILTLGTEKKEIPLVAEFATPQANPELAKLAAANAAKNQAPPVVAGQPPAGALPNAAQANGAPTVPVLGTETPVVPPAEPPPVAEQAAAAPPTTNDKTPPPLSVKEALEARQRLMASRWGALSGNAEGQAPPSPPNQ